MGDYRIAVTGWRWLESQGIRPGRRTADAGKRVPVMPVHAAREGDTEALCGEPIGEVTEDAWPPTSFVRRCRRCGQMVKAARDG